MERYLPFTGSLPKWLQWLELGLAAVRNLELCLGLLCGQQRPKCLSCHLPLSQEPGQQGAAWTPLDTGCGATPFLFRHLLLLPGPSLGVPRRADRWDLLCPLSPQCTCNGPERRMMF